MKEKPVMIELAGCDFDKTESIHKEAMAVFAPVFETMIAFFLAVVAVCGIFFFLSVQYSEEYIGRFLSGLVENGRVPGFSIVFVISVSALFLAVFWIVRHAFEIKSNMHLDRAYAYNSLLRAVSGVVAGLDALAGPGGGKAVACVDCERPAFARPRHLTTLIFGCLILFGISLLLSVSLFVSVGYGFEQHCVLMLLLGLPVLSWAFVISYNVERSLTIMVFVFVFLIVISLLESIFPQAFTFDPAFNTFLKVFYGVQVLIFLWRMLAGCAVKSLVITPGGLHLVSIDNGTLRDLSGPVVPEKLLVSPGPYGALWTIISRDKRILLRVHPSGSDPEAFIGLCRASGMEIACADEGGGRLGFMGEIRKYGANALLFAGCLFMMWMFSYPLVSRTVFASYLTSGMGDLFGTDRDGPARMEKRCNSLLSRSGGDPIALIFSYLSIDHLNRFGEQADILKRLEQHLSGYYMPVGPTTRGLFEQYSKHKELWLKLLPGERSGWEPEGAELKNFRIAVAQSLNIRRFWIGEEHYKSGAATFVEQLKSVPASPGPRAMLVWLYYKNPDSLIKYTDNWIETPSPATSEISTLMQKKALDTGEALLYLEKMIKAHQKIKEAAKMDDDVSWKGIDQTIENLLPLMARDRLLAGFLNDFLERRPLSGWEKVFAIASRYGFAAAAPEPKPYDLVKEKMDGGFQPLLFAPPDSADKYLKAFPELAKRFAPGEADSGLGWKSLLEMKEADIVKFFKGREKIIFSLPPAQIEAAKKAGLL